MRSPDMSSAPVLQALQAPRRVAAGALRRGPAARIAAEEVTAIQGTREGLQRWKDGHGWWPNDDKPWWLLNDGLYVCFMWWENGMQLNMING